MGTTCLKHLGHCLCPECFAEKSEVSQVGTPDDMQKRLHKRVDTERRQADVEKARKLIFLEGCSPSSDRVEAILNPTSALPNQVRSLRENEIQTANRLRRMRFHYGSSCSVSTSTLCSRPTSCTSLNSVCGRIT